MSQWMQRGLLASALVVACVWPAATFAAADLIEWQNMPAVTGTGKPATAEEIKRAFIVGGARRGWACVDEGPDKMVCTVIVRTHTLVMNLAYETGKYSLTYKDSVNLDYKDDGGKKTIHRAYLSWNINLMNDARVELVRL